MGGYLELRAAITGIPGTPGWRAAGLQEGGWEVWVKGSEWAPPLWSAASPASARLCWVASLRLLTPLPSCQVRPHDLGQVSSLPPGPPAVPALG